MGLYEDKEYNLLKRPGQDQDCHFERDFRMAQKIHNLISNENYTHKTAIDKVLKDQHAENKSLPPEDRVHYPGHGRAEVLYYKYRVVM